MAKKLEDYSIVITVLRTVRASSKSDAMKQALEDVNLPDDVKVIIEADKVTPWISALVQTNQD